MNDTAPDSLNPNQTQENTAAQQYSADCYSEGERGWMEWGQRIRAVVLRPLLIWLTALRVTPDFVTLLAALCGVAFLPLLLTDHSWLALGSLTIHVLLDGLDGPLARHQQVASPRGSFTDTLADQLVVTTVTIAWMVDVATKPSLFVGAFFVFVYALVVAMAMVRNALEIPYSWLVRPRFFFYGAIAVDLILGWTTTVAVLAVCNLLLSWKAWTGFRALRRRIPGPHDQQAD